MLELIVTLLFFWLFFKALGLALRMTWGLTKFFVSVLLTIALPLLIGCLLFAGGVVLLVPLALIGIAFGLVKAVL